MSGSVKKVWRKLRVFGLRNVCEESLLESVNDMIVVRVF